MTLTEIKEMTWVVVNGKAAQVISRVGIEKIKVLFNCDKTTATVSISEIEVIPTSQHVSMGVIWASLDNSYIPLNFSNITDSDFSIEDRT